MANIQNMIAYYESLNTPTCARNLAATLTRQIATTKLSLPNGENSTMVLKRKPGFHRKRQKTPEWRQSIRVWQERATKCQHLAMTQRYLEHLG